MVGTIWTWERIVVVLAVVFVCKGWEIRSKELAKNWRVRRPIYISENLKNKILGWGAYGECNINGRLYQEYHREAAREAGWVTREAGEGQGRKWNDENLKK